MTNRDKLLFSVLEGLSPHLIDILLKVQEREGVPIGKFVAEAIGEKLPSLSCEERCQQVVAHFRKQGIDLEEATGQ